MWVSKDDSGKFTQPVLFPDVKALINANSPRQVIFILTGVCEGDLQTNWKDTGRYCFFVEDEFKCVGSKVKIPEVAESVLVQITLGLGEQSKY